MRRLLVVCLIAGALGIALIASIAGGLPRSEASVGGAGDHPADQHTAPDHPGDKHTTPLADAHVYGDALTHAEHYADQHAQPDANGRSGRTNILRTSTR